MLTIGKYKNAKQLIEYFEDHLKSGDYYTEKEQIDGRWIGKTTKVLGLGEFDKVKKDEFEALVNGKHPKSGAKILIRTKENRQIGFDMAFSPPKTLSIMALTMEDTRLIEAHHKAVTVAFHQMERLAQTRVRKGLSRNSRESRFTGNLVGAQFTHTSSRELDPQLHTHHIVFNFTYDPVEKRTKALDAHQIFMGSKLISEVYRNALAKEVRELGYELEEGRHTWRIKGVSREIETRFGKRAAQIEARAQELEDETGIVVDKRGRALISLETRSAKNKELQDDELVILQRKQLSDGELKTLENLRHSAHEKAGSIGQVLSENPALLKDRGGTTSNHLPPDRPLYEPPAKFIPQDEIAKIAIRYAFEHVFERKSILHRNEVLREALKFSAGRVEFDALEAELKSPNFVHRPGQMITTREERKREVLILQHVRDGKRTFDPLGSVEHLPKYLTDEAWTNASEDEQKSQLSPEKWKAAAVLLKSQDRFLFLRGAAGAGKTSTLTHLLKASNHSHIMLTAPTSGAAEKLREEGFANATTTQKLLLSEREQSHLMGSLIVVDEAGLLSTKQMQAIFQLAEKKDARVLLVGDTKQHNSVEAGDALRLIEEFSIITRAEIGTIMRQKAGSYREAIQALSRGDVETGFQTLRGMDSIHQADMKKRPDKVAREYVEKIKQGVDTIVVTPTWDEHKEITNSVRKELKKVGLLSEKESVLGVFKSTNFTNVEKRYALNLTEGLHLSFHSNRGEFKQGDIYKIIGHADRTVTVEDSRGTKKTFRPKEYASGYDVVVKEERPFAQGDKILMKANYATSPTNRIPNGSIATIEAIESDGTIRLKGGKHLEPTFRMFTHGYAVTSPASQGKDAKHVIISANAKATGALSMNQFYVSASRGKESISVYTSNIAKFRKAISRSADRQLALENFVRNGPLRDKLEKLKISAERRMEMGRDLIERAFVKFRNEKKRKEKTLQRSRSDRDRLVDREL